jgi:hypothetical protein
MARLQFREAAGQAKQISQRLRRIQTKLDRLVAEVAGTSETSNTYWLMTRREMTALYEEMRAITKRFVTAQIPAAYDQSVRDEIAKLKASEFTPRTIHYNAFSRSNVYVQGLASILNDTLSAFDQGYLSGEATFNRLMRATQQVNLAEKQINQAIQEGYLESGSPQGTAKNLREALLEKLKDGKFVTIVDKNGDTRQYTVDAYAEMVTRTKLIEATTMGVTTAVRAAGGDLVQVSAHNTNCEICMEFEGKIYSLSGDDPDFPPATELPGFHPNCRHTIDSAFREGMEVQGTLEDFIEFSNGETEEHPTRDSFVPVSQRKGED